MSGRAVVLWRHGRTRYNAEARLQGQVDIPLDDVGRWQVGEAARELARRGVPTLVVSSDLTRAAETAQALADEVGADVELDARVRERAFGDWEGLTADDMRARWPEQYERWRAGHDPERTGAETRAEVAERLAAAVTEHAARLPEDGTLVVVSHGAAITLGLTRLLGLDAVAWRGLVGLHNAHWSLLRASRGEALPPWRLEGHNLGPAVDVGDWNAGIAADLPSTTADALRT